MSESKRPFYVGYDDEAPAPVARFVRPRLATLILMAVVLVGVTAAAQRGFVPSLYEFGVEREFVGWIGTHPYPVLQSLRPGNAEHCGAISTYPLVSSGKFGAAAVVEEFDGQQVRIRGTLVHVDDQTMIELAEGGIARLDDPVAQPDGRTESLGHHRLEGEIVDSKCYYGVMNPGTGKIHRGCAIRCLSGGIPPSFLVRDAAGGRLTMLLVDEQGRAVGRRILDLVGRPVAASGSVVRHDDLLVFYVNPAEIERL